GLYKAGGHPQSPGRKYPAPLYQRSHYNIIRKCSQTGSIIKRLSAIRAEYLFSLWWSRGREKRFSGKLTIFDKRIVLYQNLS
ncbi:MAG: hypothetical protein RI591_05410, partial [Dehalococcoidia bacterium]|nr:hypothetical protein [Dehalococcoidia bacterium]